MTPLNKFGDLKMNFNSLRTSNTPGQVHASENAFCKFWDINNNPREV